MSSPSSICIVVTPVSESPFAIAHWMGAAPRSRGSSEAWTLTVPRGAMSITARGRIWPKATTTCSSGRSSRSSAWASGARTFGELQHLDAEPLRPPA